MYQYNRRVRGAGYWIGQMVQLCQPNAAARVWNDVHVFVTIGVFAQGGAASLRSRPSFLPPLH
jgi:hypothetical protein